MKIIIDTNKDSHQEIKRAIRMLSSLLENSEAAANNERVLADDGIGGIGSGDNNAFVNMFGSVEPKKEGEKEAKKKEEMPQMIEYL